MALHRGLAAIAKRFGQKAEMETERPHPGARRPTALAGRADAARVRWPRLAAAVIVAAIVFVAAIGPRPDIAAAAATPRFLFKFVVTIALLRHRLRRADRAGAAGRPCAGAAACCAGRARCFSLPPSRWN